MGFREEAALISLLGLIFAAWYYYQDVHVHKLEFRRSRACFYLFAVIIGYPLLMLALPYFDSVQAHWDEEKTKFLVFAVVALVGAGIVLVLFYGGESSKREEFVQVARRLGFSYDPEGKTPLPKGLLQVPTFDSVGEGVTHLLRGGSLDREYAIFEHQYTVGDETTHHTIAAHRTSCLIPAFELRPETVLDKIVSAFGGIDVDFSEHPTFSSAYRLLCADEDVAVIRRMFAGGLCSLFERELGWTVGGNGNWVGLYKHRGLVESEDLQKFYEKTKGMAKAIESAARSMGH